MAYGPLPNTGATTPLYALVAIVVGVVTAPFVLARRLKQRQA